MAQHLDLRCVLHQRLWCRGPQPNHFSNSVLKDSTIYIYIYILVVLQANIATLITVMTVLGFASSVIFDSGHPADTVVVRLPTRMHQPVWLFVCVCARPCIPCARVCVPCLCMSLHALRVCAHAWLCMACTIALASGVRAE